MARVPYVTSEDLPEEDSGLLTSVRPSDEIDPEYEHLMTSDERNVYRSLAHVPESLRSIRELGGAVRDELEFAPRERETVILAAARGMGSAYEWHQHVRIGLDAGFSPAELRAISEGEYDRLEGNEPVLAEYTSAFVRGAVDPETHDALVAAYDDRTVVGVGVLAGTYLLIGHVLEALDVGIEEEFVGWNLENL